MSGSKPIAWTVRIAHGSMRSRPWPRCIPSRVLSGRLRSSQPACLRMRRRPHRPGWRDLPPAASWSAGWSSPSPRPIPPNSIWCCSQRPIPAACRWRAGCSMRARRSRRAIGSAPWRWRGRRGRDTRRWSSCSSPKARRSTRAISPARPRFTPRPRTSDRQRLRSCWRDGPIRTCRAPRGSLRLRRPPSRATVASSINSSPVAPIRMSWTRLERRR